MTDRRLLSLPIALALGGCTQLVAFGQPVHGAPDVVEEEAPAGGPLCDPEIAVGESAGCDTTCIIEEGLLAAECPRISVSDDGVSVDVSGLREVEVTLSACDGEVRPLRITGENGASVSVESGTLYVRPAGEAAAHPMRREGFVPDGECVERSLVFQTGRMELAQGGIRLCSPHLVPVEGAWALELGADLRSVELCLRAAR